MFFLPQYDIKFHSSDSHPFNMNINEQQNINNNCKTRRKLFLIYRSVKSSLNIKEVLSWTLLARARGFAHVIEDVLVFFTTFDCHIARHFTCFLACFLWELQVRIHYKLSNSRHEKPGDKQFHKRKIMHLSQKSLNWKFFSKINAYYI